MRKKVLALALLVACAGNVSAQKWLKNIGKALDKAEQVLQPGTKKTETGNTQTTSDNKQQQSNKADYTLAEVLQVDNTVVAAPVDLGLSVKWASKNLGAAQPFQYGGYYDRTAEHLSSYWGEEWRLPTEKEFEELLTKCTVKYVDAVLAGKEYMPDVAGYLLITGPNGNQIWLPAAGLKNKPTDERYNNPPGNEGFYWTSESEKVYGSTSYKWMFFQHYDGKFNYYSELKDKKFGASIRPVYVGKSNTATSSSTSSVFDGTWCQTSESMEVYLTLSPKGKMNEEIGAMEYGSIGTVFLPGYRMDNDWITSLRMEGNTAYVEYQCERTGETGKAKITYNPTAETMKIVVTQAIEGDCYATDITLKKCEPINE